MKRKVISFILSAVLISSFSMNVKATDVPLITTTETEVEEPAEAPPSLEDIEKEQNLSSSENDPGLEETLEISDSPEDMEEEKIEPYLFTIAVGEEFSLEDVYGNIMDETDQLLHLEGELTEGVLSENQIGNYLFSMTYQDSDDESHTVEILIQVMGLPVIQAESPSLPAGEPFTLEALGLSAIDPEDGDLTDEIVLKDSPVNLGVVPDAMQLHEFTIVLSVTDHDSNETVKELLVMVEQQETIVPQSITLNPINPDQTLTLSGSNRYKTATAISQAMYTTTDAVILVSSTNFPDALAAGPLAKSLQAPILLTSKDSLSSSTEEEILRLGATKVYILGGTAAVSETVENELKSKKLQVERIAGSSRYSTAIAVAEMVGPSSTVILANGNDFADAMASGSYASMSGYPILLSRSDSLSDTVRTYLGMGSENVLIIGGETAISSEVESYLRQSGFDVTRIAGSNRFNTSVEMAKYAFKDSATAVVTNGLDFADALTAVPYAAEMGLPIILTSQNRVNVGVTEYLINSQIKNFHFIGGQAAISDEVKNSMMFPSLYLVSYRSMDLKGTWTSFAKNGETLGSLDGTGMSHFEITASEEKDIYLRYSVSVTGLGWQPVKESGPSGVSGRTINGLIMELKGKDAVSYDITYRTYIKGSGWSDWVLGGVPSGSKDGQPLLAVEAKVVHGSALDMTRKIAPTYGIARAKLNLRSGAGTSYQIIGVIPNETRIKIISVSGLWAYVRYTDEAGNETYGYAHTGYIDQTSAIISIKGLENGGLIPTTDHRIYGDIAYKEGIKEVNYYVNNVLIGPVDYGYLSNDSMVYEFDAPMQTGYAVNIPKESWVQDQINVLKVEFIGMDNKREFESRYLMPSSTTTDTYVFENNNKSFHSYLNIEAAKNNPPPQVWSPNGWLDATREQTMEAMDPTAYMNHETYKYIFLDLSYQEGTYDITVEDLDKVLENKGVLHGMGYAFLKAAQDFKVNPFYLIAHSLHETGNGNSRLALGQQMDYYHAKFGDPNSELIPLSAEDKLKKWYNVYGIGAYDSDPILWGKERAYHEGWDTVEKAVYGGAKWIANGYIDRSPFPQNTLYKMRYNLKENMVHQYATDIMWAQNQSKTIKKQFDNMGVTIPLKFIIPSFGEIRN